MRAPVGFEEVEPNDQEAKLDVRSLVQEIMVVTLDDSLGVVVVGLLPENQTVGILLDDDDIGAIAEAARVAALGTVSIRTTKVN